MPNWFNLFQTAKLATIPSRSQSALTAYRHRLKEFGLDKLFHPRSLEATQESVRVYANEQYISHEGGKKPSIERILTRTAMVTVAGDRQGLFQDGRPFPENPDYFSQIKDNDPRGLSPHERLAGSKKIIISDSSVLAYGGYPFGNSRTLYQNPMRVGIYSMAGAQFDNTYLHYSLFFLDNFRPHVKNPLFSHLLVDLPTSYHDAHEQLADQLVEPENHRFGLVMKDIQPICRHHNTGAFYLDWPWRRGPDAIVFLHEAFQRYLFEDVALLLAAVDRQAAERGKPALLKATAAGMGFFAKLDGAYGIAHRLFPSYLFAVRELLKSGNYPNVAIIEFPIFSNRFVQSYENMMTESIYGNTKVHQTSRDVLEFTKEEEEAFYLCAVNPSDVNAFPGNEFRATSVESSMGNNCSLRFDQNYLLNPLILSPANHRYVKINSKDYTVDIYQAEDGQRHEVPTKRF